MFGGVMTALYALVASRENRDRTHNESYIHLGQRFPLNKIYCESAVERCARQELASVRYKERLQQQVKVVRLMKKLLVEVKQEMSNDTIDDELEQIHSKVAQLELEVERTARRRNINCDDAFAMNTPDDVYDIEFEQIIRYATLTFSTVENIQSETMEQTFSLMNTKLKQFTIASGDNVHIQTLDRDKYKFSDGKDQVLVECQQDKK